MTDKKYTAELLVLKPSAFEVEKAIEKSKTQKSEGTGSNFSRIYSCRWWNRHTRTHARAHTHTHTHIYISIENKEELPQQGKEFSIVCEYKKDDKN